MSMMIILIRYKCAAIASLDLNFELVLRNVRLSANACATKLQLKPMKYLHLQMLCAQSAARYACCFAPQMTTRRCLSRLYSQLSLLVFGIDNQAD